ncbi:integrase catalytic domain-containing protein [Nephila pilipes]|uniref:Integrase catalytic domain-containing protein n=1 Tax=Nephila pilipes TaxID=299642 RepID=A0A8X6QKS2_NEPPI|nr:integrase catalytic domain-containing protein [Nephila pilipes]
MLLLKKPFLKLRGEVERLADIEIPCYFEINYATQMHLFADVCKKVFAISVFLRSVTFHYVKVVLVRAKSRVASLTQVIIPRLELMTCCIGVRLAHSIQQALNIMEMGTNFWSHSIIAFFVLVEGQRRGVGISFEIE